MKLTICTNFESRCKDSNFLTYAVYDKEAGEFVEGTEDTNLEQVNDWAYKLNTEEDQKRLSIGK